MIAALGMTASEYVSYIYKCDAAFFEDPKKNGTRWRLLNQDATGERIIAVLKLFSAKDVGVKGFYKPTVNMTDESLWTEFDKAWEKDGAGSFEWKGEGEAPCTGDFYKHLKRFDGSNTVSENSFGQNCYRGLPPFANSPLNTHGIGTLISELIYDFLYCVFIFFGFVCVENRFANAGTKIVCAACRNGVSASVAHA